ncbi:MAG: hypothetical protein ACYDGL_02595 [Bellilinea sp.]
MVRCSAVRHDLYKRASLLKKDDQEAARRDQGLILLDFDWI